MENNRHTVHFSLLFLLHIGAVTVGIHDLGQPAEHVIGVANGIPIVMNDLCCVADCVIFVGNLANIVVHLDNVKLENIPRKSNLIC